MRFQKVCLFSLNILDDWPHARGRVRAESVVSRSVSLCYSLGVARSHAGVDRNVRHLESLAVNGGRPLTRGRGSKLGLETRDLFGLACRPLTRGRGSKHNQAAERHGRL